MKKADFINAISDHEYDLASQLIERRNHYGEVERREIFKLCRTISRSQIPTTADALEPVKFEVLRPYFLRSLTIFDSSIISDYFTEKTKTLRVLRCEGCTSSDIRLKYKLSEGRPVSLKMIIPRKKLVFSDQMGYAHEIGHIPELDSLRKSYLEYSEVLPMFLEYIIELRKHPNYQDALNYFLLELLPMEQDIARDILKICKLINEGNSITRKYHTNLLADSYAFLESLDYVIQLIERSKDDFVAVKEEIEAVLQGRSFIQVAQNLDIDTSNCLTLKREYKRISRI